jgi:D-aspartate ligase
MRGHAPRGPLAIVLGARSIEVVRALAMVGAPCAVVTGKGDPVRWSRYARNLFTWDWMQPLDRHDAALADRLVDLGRRQPRPPVLTYCSDQSMVFVSRHRDRLAQAFRFVVPEAGLVEAMADKAKFCILAGEKSLPVPATCVLETDLPAPPEDLRRLGFPFIMKPTVRDTTWVEAAGSSTKALRIESDAQLREFWPRLRRLSGPAIVQQCIDGPETAVVSYHVYVDERGEVAGEFTGRKIRTIPVEYGHTSALTITDDPAVARLGREVVHTLDMRGVAKLDFKEAPDGRLYLLEINARFSLWNHPGARAGINLPGMVYADMTGTPRPPRPTPRFGLDWVHPKDLIAARAHGLSLGDWLRWTARTRPVTGVWRWDDPLPLVGMAAIRARNAALGRSSAGKLLE